MPPFVHDWLCLQGAYRLSIILPSCVLLSVLPYLFCLYLIIHYSQLTLVRESQVNLCSFIFHFVHWNHAPYPTHDFSHIYSAACCFCVMIFFHLFPQLNCLSVYIFLFSSCLFIETMYLLLRNFLFNERSCKKCLWGMENFCLNLFHDSFLCYMSFICLLFITLNSSSSFYFPLLWKVCMVMNLFSGGTRNT